MMIPKKRSNWATVERRYRLPDIPMRLNNTEMAVLKGAEGEPVMATAAGANMDGKVVLAWPDGRFRTISHRQAGLVMQADEQGRLVFGKTDLVRYDPVQDRFETLAANCTPHLWGGCVTRRLIVTGASTPDGTVTVYDRRSRNIVRRFVPLHPQAFYHYRFLEAPDGKILIVSCFPKAVLTLLDPDTLEPEHCLPEALADVTDAHGAQFLDGHRLYLHHGNLSLILSYPNFETLARIRAPRAVGGWGRKTVLLPDGRVAAWGFGTNRPYALDVGTRRWTPLIDRPVVPVEAGDSDGHTDAWCALPDGTVAGITTGRILFRIRPGSRQAETQRLDIVGRSSGAPLLVVPSLRKAFGSAHCLQQFWEVELNSGAGRNLGRCGPGGGQVNAMVWDTALRRLFMASYTSCSALEYDPARGGSFPDNPRILATVEDEQMRPLEMIRIGESLWMTSSAKYGIPGGALSRIHRRTGAVKTFRHLVRDQTPTTMLAAKNGQRLYLATTVEGDNQSTTVAENARACLVVFDTRREKVLRAFPPFRSANTLWLWTFLPDGRILFGDGPPFADGAVLWTWAPRTDTIVRFGAAPPGLRQALLAPDGALWATGYEGIGPLQHGDPCRIVSVVQPAVARRAFDRVCKFLQWDGPRLWFSTGDRFACIETRAIGAMK